MARIVGLSIGERQRTVYAAAFLIKRVNSVAVTSFGVHKRSEILHRYEVEIELEHVAFGYQDVALHLHDTGKRGDKILDEYLTTVCSLRANKIRRLDTSISQVEMLNAFFV
jgi:uncharacterized protein